MEVGGAVIVSEGAVIITLIVMEIESVVLMRCHQLFICPPGREETAALRTSFNDPPGVQRLNWTIRNTSRNQISPLLLFFHTTSWCEIAPFWRYQPSLQYNNK